jgi:hypothetical protein
MLILVPWKPFVFVWGLLTAMILMGYAVYCVQEGRNPFSIDKHHLQQAHPHHASRNSVSPQRHSGIATRNPRHNSRDGNAAPATWRSDL